MTKEKTLHYMLKTKCPAETSAVQNKSMQKACTKELSQNTNMRCLIFS